MVNDKAPKEYPEPYLMWQKENKEKDNKEGKEK